MPRLSWSEAFGLAMATVAVLMVVRMSAMAVNDMILCPERRGPICPASTIERLMFGDIGTIPR